MTPYETVTTSLKAYLRDQKISQSALAYKMDIPESTVKKWLNAEDGSIGRLNDVCSTLGLSLGDLLSSAENKEVNVLQFSENQQDFFESNPKALEVFWLLVYERHGLEYIEKKVKLTHAEIKKMLYRFDRLGLIDMLPNDKMKIGRPAPIRWRPEGRFIEKIFEKWSISLLKESLRSKENLVLQYFQLSDDLASEFYADIKKLEEKYARLTIKELSAGKKNTKKIRFLSCAAEGSFF